MSHHYKILAMITLAGSLITLSGCIVAPDKNNAYGSSTGNYNQPQHAGSSRSSASGAGEWDRGCADAKAGSYDRSGNAGQAYEDGWNACKSGNRPSYGGGASQGRPVSLDGIQGMEGWRSVDELTARGFDGVDSFSSGNDLVSIYYNRSTGQCIQTITANNRIDSVNDIQTHPKCR